MLIKGTEVWFAHRDVNQATAAEIEKLTELVVEEQRYHYQHGTVDELMVLTDNLGRNVRYQTVVNVEHQTLESRQQADFGDDEDLDRLRNTTC